jgi:sirohydrochlorin ferrochelatase
VADGGPVLVACAHGTRSAEGRAVVRTVVEELRRLAPEVDVREAFVDVQQPAVADAVVAVDGPAVVVPLLLSTGVHVRADIGAAVAAGRDATAADPLGPDERLVDVLLERLAEVGATAQDAVVLAAAGSSDPAGAVAVCTVLAGLRRRWPGPVTVGYGAAAPPTVAEAVTAARVAGAARVVVAAYLLGPGHFYSAVLRSGGDLVTTPLAPHPLVARIALDRYRDAGHDQRTDPPERRRGTRAGGPGAG